MIDPDNIRNINRAIIELTKHTHTYIRIYISIYAIWLFNIAMEKSTIFKNGKASISMGHLYHGYVSHNQRVYLFYFIWLVVPTPLKKYESQLG